MHPFDCCHPPCVAASPFSDMQMCQFLISIRISLFCWNSQSKGNRIRQGGPNEQAALVAHIAELQPRPQHLVEAAQLCELLILLGHEADARILQQVSALGEPTENKKLICSSCQLGGLLCAPIMHWHVEGGLIMLPSVLTGAVGSAGGTRTGYSLYAADLGHQSTSSRKGGRVFQASQC